MSEAFESAEQIRLELGEKKNEQQNIIEAVCLHLQGQ